MADTGAPWNLPYPLPTDLVRDGAQAIEDLAEATADGLDAAAGLVAVKHVLKTDTFTSGSVAAGGNVAVTGLSITHEVADPANRLIITAYFGVAANSRQQGNVGIAVAKDEGAGPVLIGVGGGEAIRSRVGAGGVVVANSTGNISARVVTMPSVTFVHEPNTTDSVTYTVRAVNIDATERTLYVNRSEDDGNVERVPRAASALVIQEVKV